MAEKLKNRFTKVGPDQLKEGVEFKKILGLMRQQKEINSLLKDSLLVNDICNAKK